MPASIFFCYAQEDEALLNKLQAHLRPLQRQGLIDVWHDRNISAGADWQQQVNQHLNTADIVLLLVSVDFINSDYCYDSMTRAMERHRSGKAHVIPIILRQVDWQGTPFGALLALPTDGAPITGPKWHHQDDAFYNIVRGIREVIDKLHATPPPPATPSAQPQQAKKSKGKKPQKTVEQYLSKIDAYRKQKNYEQAIATCLEALRLDTSNVYIYEHQSYALYKQQKYHEALEVCEKAIARNLLKAGIFANKGTILNALERYREALAACERAIKLEPSYVESYIHKSKAFYKLQQYENAVKTCEQAIRLAPSRIEPYLNKSSALYKLQRYEDVIKTCEQALQQNAHDISIMMNKIRALLKLERYAQVVKICEQVLQLDPTSTDAIKHKNDALEHLGK